MAYDPTLGLLIADSVLLSIYVILFAYEIYVVFHYLVPLRIKSPYMIASFVILSCMFVSCIVMLLCRLLLDQTGYEIVQSNTITAG